jgi:hypothetical protein
MLDLLSHRGPDGSGIWSAPVSDERELVLNRDRRYDLNGEDSRTLAAVGVFRVVREHDLDTDPETVEHLRGERLVETVDLGDGERGLTLTREGRDLLDAHSLNRDGEPSQAFYAGVSRERELNHDSHLYSTYRQEEARLRDEHDGFEVRRVVLEQDLKREYQEFLQEHNRGRADSDGRPDRDEHEIRAWARETLVMEATTSLSVARPMTHGACDSSYCLGSMTSDSETSRAGNVAMRAKSTRKRSTLARVFSPQRHKDTNPGANTLTARG